MKKIIYSLLLVSSIAFSQTEKNVGDFNKVTSFDQIDVLLIPSDENKVVLDGSGSEDVEIVNKNGELKIRMRLTKMLSGDNISATVYYKNIDAVEANEGSRISSEATFEATIFDIKAKEGSQIKIKINVDRLTARIGNGSTVTISGTAKNQDVLINSGGIYEAERLETNQTIITANAGGDADVYATDLVDAKVRAGGDIRIFGKPKQINQKIIAGGTIKEGND
ncbi:head GIN domain-containing protein [Flavobacterium sp.]|uniref:head GIN domain-containing protein n=1 Tax=Flavobacterium sp. TaxID=239 RepID=UPI00260B9982|nr:head GIN domain-containing protein [Flavobacterium sp.]